MQIKTISNHGTSKRVSRRLNCQLLGACGALSEELKSALLSIPAGIIFVNPMGIVELANEPATRIFEQDVDGLQWREVIEQHFLPQKDDGLEVSLRNGRKIKFSISSLPDIPGQLIHLTDLTTTRVLQSRLSHMEKLSSLGKMVASLAHQLRTPLSAAVLYAMNLKSPNINKAMQDRFSSKLVSRLKDLEGQINDMLLFAKSGSKGVLETLDLETFLRTIVAETQDSVEAQKVKITFFAMAEGEMVSLNSNAVKGAISNLLNNAIQAGASKIEVVYDVGPDGFEVSISDNGSGIPKGVKTQIFEPFYTTRSQGTGLGLAVVAAVATSHKGSVAVQDFSETEFGTGTEFKLTFPPCLKSNSSKSDIPQKQSFAGEKPFNHERLAGELA